MGSQWKTINVQQEKEGNPEQCPMRHLKKLGQCQMTDYQGYVESCL